MQAARVDSDKVRQYEEHTYIPKKVETKLNNVIIYDVQTFNRDRPKP